MSRVLFRNRMSGHFDGGQNLGACLGIKLVAVEAEEEGFADSFRGSLCVLFTNRGFHEGACGLAHGASHHESFFPGLLHQHGPVAVVYFARRIIH